MVFKMLNVSMSFGKRTFSILLFMFALLSISCAQHEDIPYEDVANICETCDCMNAQDADKKYHHLLDCSAKNFNHILARWPSQFGSNHNGVDIIATFSGNKIQLLQQLPSTNGTLTFICRHCNTKDIQAPAFMDVPNIIRLDLSWNKLSIDSLSPDTFRGPYKNTGYEPIALRDLNLGHNEISSLPKLIFEHTPNITKLNLSYNKLQVLDASTIQAISSASSLESLDLSYNGLDSISSKLFESLIELKSLSLQGNRLKSIPNSINLIGKTVEYLNFAANPIKSLNENHFNGLKVLKKLNISFMNDLTTIENGTFTHLESLEHLSCNRNPKLYLFDNDGLLHCKNMSFLDISSCNLESINIDIDLPQPLPDNFKGLWPQLHSVNIFGNPWICDCKFLRILELMTSNNYKNDKLARCYLPFDISGVLISNLTSSYVCNLPNEFIIPENEDPPKFLRRRYIKLTIVTITVVLFIGLLIGFLTVYIRRRLKRDDFGIGPIRYTSVRVSNQSAMSVTR